MRLVRLEYEDGSVYHQGLPPYRAAREMFVTLQHLKFMLEQHGACIVEDPAWIRATWAARTGGRS